MDNSALGNLIENCSEPVVLRNIVKWKILRWDLLQWGEILQTEFTTRVGKIAPTRYPQWEFTTPMKHINFETFLSTAEDSNTTDWFYFDYKYLRDIPLISNRLRKEISWEDFGLTGIDVNDSTLWVGSKGAHTSCHIDTYSCNLIVQIYGCKLWLLFPPDEKTINPIRVPYEESSIYTTLNLYSPIIEDIKISEHCRKVILNPGDCLFVPHKWWHYVESLNTSISINMWLPQPEDDEERFNEAIVRFIISETAKTLTERQQYILLHPNSESVLQTDSAVHWNLIRTCSYNIKRRLSKKKMQTVDDIRNECLNVERIPSMAKNDFRDFLQKQANRFANESYDETNSKDIEDLLEICYSILNAKALMSVKRLFV